jgi:hypothetical protein
VAWCWRYEDKYELVVVNLSVSSAQGQVQIPWKEVSGRNWKMTDFFTGRVFERNGAEMCYPGLYVDLPPWGFHMFTRWASLP